jgi:hypothetical protein
VIKVVCITLKYKKNQCKFVIRSFLARLGNIISKEFSLTQTQFYSHSSNIGQDSLIFLSQTCSLKKKLLDGLKFSQQVLFNFFKLLKRK